MRKGEKTNRNPWGWEKGSPRGADQRRLADVGDGEGVWRRQGAEGPGRGREGEAPEHEEAHAPGEGRVVQHLLQHPRHQQRVLLQQLRHDRHHSSSSSSSSSNRTRSRPLNCLPLSPFQQIGFFPCRVL
ncbi:hypothetical protein Taro_027359 [Colocasia esculenta]|uniref:Uncharacterized protein n=1 Tax=Colocasia esculenta TaxID=4460 RepID=A0A843VNH8_COLES|nr:hypothetical protein [Colocasia esculenta]